MDLAVEIQQLVDYIEEHLAEPLDVPVLAEKMGYSRYYLSKVFSVYTGMTLMAYVRQRKLACAMSMLATDKRIIDIAYDVGYRSERAFTRAFRETYGQSPSLFRSKQEPAGSKLTIYPLKLSAGRGSIRMKTYLSDVRYETIEKMTVISGRAYGSEPEDAIIGQMFKFAGDKCIEVQRSLGFDVPVDVDLDIKDYRGYEFWLVVGEGFDSSLIEGSDYVIKEVPAMRYVAVRIEDPMKAPFERIPGGWKALVGWMEEHGVKGKSMEPGYCFEDVKKVDGLEVMDIYIAVD